MPGLTDPVSRGRSIGARPTDHAAPHSAVNLDMGSAKDRIADRYDVAVHAGARLEVDRRRHSGYVV